MRRLGTGGRIDRSASVGFTFEGTALSGFRGDTLASALIANGVDVVCPSPILGRPRGVMSAGVEEPCAFVEISVPLFDPIAPATAVELVEGLVSRGLPGVGRLPGADHATTPGLHRYAHVETLVIGGGRSGLRAAREAVSRGDRVILADERSWLGGVSSHEGAPGADAPSEPDGMIAELSGAADTELLPRTTALGVYDSGFVVLHERSRPVERLWHVRAARVVLASGAHERPIAFADDDRPGVMLAGAVRLYLERFAVVPGSRVVVFTSNDPAYATAWELLRAGAHIEAIVDVRDDSPAQRDARREGIEVLSGGAVIGTEGDPRVSAVHIEGADGRRTVEADLLAVSGGWNPVTQLARAIGCGTRYDEERACFVADGSGPGWLEIVGRAAGAVPNSAAYWSVPADDRSRHFVDFQRDQTVADIEEAVGEGLRSMEHVKRATYIGTAIDQGRTSGVVTAEVVNQLLGWDPGAQGPSNPRPPYTPVPYAVLAGRHRGDLLDPVRRTPVHRWHEEHGVHWENVGQWRRPRFFPGESEDMDAAVSRECLSVRTAAGVLDASTLGKIEVIGPDAGAFLDRMYTNRMSSLKVGRIRYGLMLGLDGMVFDDGVAMRLAEDRFLVTTTTGGAASVLDRFEEWLQTEWPHLRVYCTSVTEQWATIGVAGPRARDVVTAIGTDIDLSPEGFGFMTFRDGVVDGVPARVARVSFSGELSYEINVDGRYGQSVWQDTLAAGADAGLQPYGTEAMHVLRAEKGFIIVGQDTDGTVTPGDLGMDWIVSNDGDFIGKRSLVRRDTLRHDRKQLVGLLPIDPEQVLPEGAQLVLEEIGTIPMPMIGHVTSSYRSPVLGCGFALALLERGRELSGSTVYAPLPGGTIAATVTDPVFYDPEGARRDG
ncbi:MAG: glycine cleavage T C-terminal barrel domain-containing protein [Actinomycetota bacterium]